MSQPAYEPIAELLIADSRFLGFCFQVASKKEALQHQAVLKAKYPDAAHVPVIFPDGFEDDGEPTGSVGARILPLMPMGLAVVVVRYFKSKLLGVSCGRLPFCYQSIGRLTLHRYQYRDQPHICEVPYPLHNVYGLAAGDCELILNVFDDPYGNTIDQVIEELDFGGFRGAQGEVLPRLQNLQADLSDNIIPVYRYPGNYNGQEWVTFSWAPTSWKIKQAVEKALAPLVLQKMNHCVANYYRDGKDFIAHHSDKTLDLNQDGVIVSVSLGDERVLELRRRQAPHDITRITLPHKSMLVLGPHTNKLFSHSILAKEGSVKPRISLTLRDVKTFLDRSTGRLFGQGVTPKSVSEVRTRYHRERIGWWASFGVLSAWWLVAYRRKNKEAPPLLQSIATLGLFQAGIFSLRSWNDMRYFKQEEKAARDFFSKSSMTGTKY